MAQPTSAPPRTTALFLIGLAILAFATTLHGQNFCTTPTPPCNPNDPKSKCYVPDEPSCKCKPKDCKKCTASPGYVGSGVYETSALDLSIPTSGFPLEAARVYSSAHAVDGPTGFGWKSSFHARLFYATYLYAAPSTYYKEAQVIMPDGEHLRYVDNGSGVFTPPEGRYDTLVRNADGTFDLTFQRSRSVLRFSSEGLLVSMTDDYGNPLALTYDANGRLERVSETSGSGRYLDVYWGANGRISSIQDHSGRIVSYGYDTQGMLTSVTNPLNQTTTYSYVPGRFAPLLSRITDHWGRVITDITWDAQGRVRTYSENGESYTYEYAYDNVAGQTAKVDGGGFRWIYPFGADGLISERRPPEADDAASSFTVYYPDGSVEQTVDEVGVLTYYTYAGQGRVASVTKDRFGSQAVRFDYTYDTNFPEKVSSILPKNPSTGANDPNWQGWQYEYYQAGSPAPGALHRVYRVKSDGVTTELMASYVYDTRGRVTQVTDAAGAVTDYVYDAAGNLQTVTAPSNNDAGTRPVTSYGYDTLGRVTSVTDPLGKITTYTYDAVDRILTVTLPKPVPGSSLDFTTTYTYDNWDPGTGLTSTHVTDPNGVVTKQGYDQFGRLRRSTDGLGNATIYGYTRDMLTSITDANGNETRYGYDILKRFHTTLFPNGAAETYRYRADGLLRRKMDRKTQWTDYTYDAHKRLKRKTYPNGTYIEYSYTGQKLTQVYDNSVSPAETHTFGYDDWFRVTSNEQASRGEIVYTYGANDAVATMTTLIGSAVTYSYYPDGSLNTMEWSAVPGQFKYAYRLNGQYGTITMPNGQTRSYGYDDQGRLTQLGNAHPTAGNLATFDYGYDLNHATAAYDRLGQRVSMTASVPSQNLTSALTKYVYDANYQLTRAEYPSPAPFYGDIESWTYDAIGNRLTSTKNGFTTSYTYQKIGTNPNNWQRLVSAGAVNHTYDNNGNTTAEGANTYGWDYENRMTSISGDAAVTYTYDYQGRRTSKTVNGVRTTYLYDGLNTVSEWSAATLHSLSGPGIDEPLAMAGGGHPVTYFTADGLGSVITTANASGVTQNSYAYDVWGAARSATEAIPQPYRYTAREIGDLPNQMFYRARYYASPIGRFLSEDPLQEWLPIVGAQIYTYVLNAPVQYQDPSGLICVSKMFKGGRTRSSRPDEWDSKTSVIEREQPYVPRIPIWKGGAVPVFGGTEYICHWENVLTVTKYFNQKYDILVICTCPTMIRSLSYEREEADKHRYRKRWTTSSVNAPCAKITDVR